MTDSTAPVRSWMARMPDVAFLAILGALVAIGVAGLRFAMDVSNRLVRMETRIEAIADHVGVDDHRHASR
jgi:hypothetical protein